MEACSLWNCVFPQRASDGDGYPVLQSPALLPEQMAWFMPIAALTWVFLHNFS